MSPTQLRLAPIALASATALLSFQVHAQSGAPAGDTAPADAVLPSVKVTSSADLHSDKNPGFVAKRSTGASKTDTPLIETPRAVTVVTRDQIDAQGMTQLRDVVGYSAGVVSSFLDSRIDSFKFRGNDPVQYLDGLVRQSGFYNTTRPEMYTLERVEIVRGPASVLYGQGGVGGVIGMTSKMPQAETQREIQVQLGNFDRKQVAVDFTGAMEPEGKWLYRFIGLARESGTQVDYVSNDRFLIAPSIMWRDADTSLNFQLLYQKDKSGSLIEFYPWQGTLLPSPYGQIPTNRFISEPGWDRFDTEQAALSWQLSHRFNDTWTARQNFRYSDASSDYFTMYTSFTADPTDTPPRPARPVFNADGRTVQRDIVAQVHGSTIQAIDNQAEANFATGAVRHKLLTGLDFQHIVRTQSSFRGVAPDIDVYAPVYGNFTAPTVLTPQPTVTQRQMGVYLQDQLKWENWVANVGVRHDNARSKTDGNARAAADDSATTASAGVVYLAPWGLAPYVSYNESFLPLGGFNAYNEAYKPQRGKQWEAGVKWEPTNSRTTALATVYDLRDTNRRTADPANPLNNLQAGEVRTKGYELELRTQLDAGWSGSLAHAYTNARVTQSNTADLGKRLASVPEHVSSLWVMKQTHVAGGHLSVGAGARRTGESWDGTDTLATPAYTLYDAMAAWEQGNWRVALNVTNVTDKIHVTTCLARGDCFFGTRRTGILTARYLF